MWNKKYTVQSFYRNWIKHFKKPHLTRLQKTHNKTIKPIPLQPIANLEQKKRYFDWLIDNGLHIWSPVMTFFSLISKDRIYVKEGVVTSTH